MAPHRFALCLLLATTVPIMAECPFFPGFIASSMTPPSFERHALFTNGMWLWQVDFSQSFQSPPCTDGGLCITNITVTGGTLLSSNLADPSAPVGTIRCAFLQMPGAQTASVEIRTAQGCSETNWFEYPPVVELSVRLIDRQHVEICWNSAINARYQVQYWAFEEFGILADEVPGNGAINCVTDTLGANNRFYRIVTPPPDRNSEPEH